MDIYPTYLYIKQHKITGLKYFGKTTKIDPVVYKGSGTYWLRHIKTHGRSHVITLWYKLFTNEKELTEYALKFSIENNIVESKEWANLTTELGIDGLPKGHVFTEQQRKNMSLAQKDIKKPGTSKAMKGNTLRKGKKLSTEQKLNCSKAKIGNKNRLGILHSEEIKQIISERTSLALKGKKKPIITCPHCNKSGGNSNMTRYHFNNCKSRSTVIQGV